MLKDQESTGREELKSVKTVVCDTVGFLLHSSKLPVFILCRENLSSHRCREKLNSEVINKAHMLRGHQL